MLQGQGSEGALARAPGLPLELLRRRAGQRRHILIVQAGSCSLITLVLLVYCYAGTISIIIPSAYFLLGMGMIGFFVVLSEAHISDRFDDPYLTLPRSAAMSRFSLCSCWRRLKSDMFFSACCF